MKKSLATCRILGITLFLLFSASAIQPLLSGDTGSKTETAVMGAFVLPLCGASFFTPARKTSEWKKEGPMICLVIGNVQMPAGGQQKAIVLPQNSTLVGVMPGENVVMPEGGVVAIGANNNLRAPVEAVFADFALGRVLGFQYSIGDTYVAATKIPVLPQYSNDTLPTGVTLVAGSSAFATFAAMANYLTKFPNLFTKLVVTVDDTANFDQNITLTKTHSDGNPSVVSASWNQLALDTYAQVQTVRTIEKRFVSGADVRYEFTSIVPGSGLTKKWTFRFEAGGVANTFNMRRPEF